MTQTEFNNNVIALASKETELMHSIAIIRSHDDPDSKRQEERYMFFRNILEALENYDITSEILSDNNISLLFELGTLSVRTIPS